MTLHYAPTTPEEEELALALALSASLSSAPGILMQAPSQSQSQSQQQQHSQSHAHPHAQQLPHLPPIVPPAIPRSKSAAGPSGMFGAAGGSGGGTSSGSGSGGGSGRGSGGGPGVPSASSNSGSGAAAAGAGSSSQPSTARSSMQLHSDPEACAGCGRGFGLFTASWVTGMGRKWHPGCFKCGLCQEAISNGRGAYSYQMHPGDPLPYHPDCYRHVHHPLCHVCGSYVAASPDGVISYRENGFWRERYCTTHAEAALTRCCACSRLQKQAQCLSSVVLDTPDAQPLYDEVLAFYAREMNLPHAYKPPLLLVDGPTLNSHAEAEGRDDSGGAPVFHVRGLCVAHVYSHIASIRRDVGGTVRSVATELLNLTSSSAAAGGGGGGRSRVHCHVKVLLLLYGLPRLLSGSIMAHELMHAWLRMEGVVGLSAKVEEGLCQLMACLWLDRQHELLKGKQEEQRLASFFSYQIRTDTSEVYGDGFREAMEAFQSIGFAAVIQNVKRYGRFM
ncbi:hypothetical protein VOLCADRAFT_106269 [Volvox carteri f. nagariensis]|uniref:LIM zinc-binding domain-containing protein n=1 Tax=Volvox carteri f. nagariensis TaxID=3068 RepID=D8U692_VOLCA|nr:uncharacterized protein VOLCADRAFT_106269 [Volvox carteri f. nagariensis]EFJ44813.1 hypothetical protein VOLCADRAFT_106269 [Volvox carteri f. nagariensis]|eukprot:XP_002954096.1 hypothetical protein VOLCADRAFT_106269 [Volvox carteri f. nagariensis]